MKKHTFQDAMGIFAKMYEGWNMVDSNGNKRPLTSVDPDNGLIACKGVRFGAVGCSHIEQTKPMNGDEVWAWDDNDMDKYKRVFISKTPEGYMTIGTKSGRDYMNYDNVELIAPFKTATIEEAEKMLTEFTKENYKITP